MPGRLTALLAVLAIGLVACGGDDDSADQFREEFPQVNQEILALGQEVGQAIEDASNATDEQLAADFDDFAQQLGSLRDQLEELDPPEDLAEERDALASALGDVRGSLADIASAAEQGDAQAATAATRQLIQSSAELRDARQALAQAVRQEQ